MKDKAKSSDVFLQNQSIPPEMLKPILKGRNTLKVASVIAIIFFSFGILLFYLSVVLLFTLWGEELGRTVILLILFGLVCGVGLTAGILGIQAGRNPRKAKVCLIFGSVLLIYYGFSFIWGLANMASQAAYSILIFVPSLILSAVYFDGAYRYDRYYRDYLIQMQDEEEL